MELARRREGFNAVVLRQYFLFEEVSKQKSNDKW